MRHWFEDRIVQPRLTGGPGGIDHGAPGHVLAELRRGNQVHRRLVWIGGSRSATCGVRGYGQTYHPASLSISGEHGYAAAYPDLRGGRLTKERLVSRTAFIDAAFGAGTTALVDLRRTLVIVDDPQ